MKMTYNIGDKVRIANYGNPMWCQRGSMLVALMKNCPIIQEDEKSVCIDISPSLIGKEGVIDKTSDTQGIESYSIDGVGAWFFADQLEIIIKNNAYANNS